MFPTFDRDHPSISNGVQRQRGASPRTVQGVNSRGGLAHNDGFVRGGAAAAASAEIEAEDNGGDIVAIESPDKETMDLIGNNTQIPLLDLGFQLLAWLLFGLEKTISVRSTLKDAATS